MGRGIYMWRKEGRTAFFSSQNSNSNSMMEGSMVGSTGLTMLKLYRAMCAIFLIVVIGFISDDLRGHAFTKYTFWGLLISTVYFIVSLKPFWGTKNERYTNFLLVVFTTELFICIVYWSLFSDHYGDKTTAQQFHIVGAHAIVQLLLFVDLVACMMGDEKQKVKVSTVTFYLSAIFVIYCTAVYSYCYHNEEDFPYYVADPNKEDASAAIVLGAMVLQVVLAVPVMAMYTQEWNIGSPKKIFLGQSHGFSHLESDATGATSTKSLGSNLHF